MASEVARIQEPFVPKLEALGQWCDASKLFIERAHVAETLLSIDPDHEQARAWLRYARQKDRSWKLTSTRPFFDEKKDLVPEFDKRHADVARPLREALEPLLDETDEWHTAGVRDHLLRTLVALFPDDADLRERNGERLADGKWILKASADAAAGRRAIGDLAAEAGRDGAKQGPAVPQKQSDVAVCLSSPDFELRSRVSLAETQELASQIIAARQLAAGVLDRGVRFAPHFVVHLFGSFAEAQRYGESRTDVAAGRRAWMRGHDAFWPQDEELVIGADAHDSRIDVCVREIISTLRTRDGFELNSAPGWMSEGVGMYLTYALVGTRLTAFVQPTQYADTGVSRDLAQPGADWVQAVRRLVVDKGAAPNLRVLTGLPLNSMTRDDGLMAYALAAYFLEGCPDDFRRMYARLGKQASFHQCLAETFNLDVDALELRFVRWLRETK